jgi:DNA-directed RNA polymerase subunit RPC12/RpoP
MDSGRNDDRGPREAPRKRELTTEERIHLRGLRHAVDRDANAVIRCHSCGQSVQNLDGILPDTNCPYCNSPLHCCRTCREFDSAARWQCHATIEKPVASKGQANDCAKYAPRLVLDSTGKRSTSSHSAGNARAQFDNLFKR